MSRQLPDRILDVQRRFDQYCERDLNMEISSADAMFDHRSEGNLDHYLRVGRNAVEIIAESMILAGTTDANTILDMPCGHGRVLRHLVNFFPESSIMACDIDKSAVDFCGKTFAIETSYSDKNLRRLDIGKKFDLIFCGSLLTHLPEESFRDALDFLARSLSDRGLAIVTLHGRASIWIQHNRCNYMSNELFSEVETGFNLTGFGYADYRDVSNYGISVSAPSYVMAIMETLPNLQVIRYSEKTWDDHQDVLVFSRRWEFGVRVNQPDLDTTVLRRRLPTSPWANLKRLFARFTSNS